jgi:hypothetical protein
MSYARTALPMLRDYNSSTQVTLDITVQKDRLGDHTPSVHTDAWYVIWAISRGTMAKSRCEKNETELSVVTSSEGEVQYQSQRLSIPLQFL